MDVLQRVVHVRRRLHVDGDVVRAGFGEVGDLALRALDHQVHVDERSGDVDLVGERLDDDRTHRDRRDEVAVHDVDVDDGRPGVEHGLDLLAEAREVRGEDRGGDPVERAATHIGVSIELWQWLHTYSAVLDILTIVECSPQFGQTERSS